MNSLPPNDPLKRALRAWSPAVAPNPRFRAEVWARIEQAQTRPPSWTAWARQHLWPVTGLAATTAVLAVALGVFTAQAQAGHAREEMLQAYLVSIDPHQQIREVGR